jgi:hypothetical protein
MNKAVVTTLLVGTGATALVFLASLAGPPAAAQVKYEAPPPGVQRGEDERMNTGGLLAMVPDPLKYPVPRTKWDGKPDFSGVYWDSGYPGADETKTPTSLDLMDLLTRPEEWAARKTLDPGVSRGMHCWPESPVHGSMHPRIDIHLVSAPGFFVMINTGMGNHRIIPTDGGTHDKTAPPTFQGDSVGHWDGDTLVVEVTNFRDQPVMGMRYRDRWSDALRVVERWTMPDSRFFEYEAWVEDPKTLSGPWQAPKIRRGRTIRGFSQETFCVQNDTLLRINSQQAEGAPARAWVPPTTVGRIP